MNITSLQIKLFISKNEYEEDGKGSSEEHTFERWEIPIEKLPKILKELNDKILGVGADLLK